MNLGQLKKSCRRLLLDSPELDGWVDKKNFSITDSDLVDAINYAIIEYAKRCPDVYKRTASISVDASGFATIPTAYINVSDVTYNGFELLAADKNYEALKSRSWISDTGNPVKWCIFDGSKVKIIPIPKPFPANPTCTIGFVEQPTLLVSDSDNVDSRIPASRQHYLKYAAAAFIADTLWDRDAAPMADRWMTEFDNLMNGIRR